MHVATEGAKCRKSQDKLLESSEVESSLTNSAAAKGLSFPWHRSTTDGSVTLQDSNAAN
jgi:hypothetical protein